ncbi:MAG TPA: 16S rRNA processing protein RimM [Arcobacter sp.]|jgi:16S rRNA processing protein RimM|nr:16S rRNA processing protein RimM [Arcobacter sp.]
MENIYVAKLGKAVGLKGQMRLFIESDFPEQFKKGSSFTTNKNLKLTIDTINSDKDLVKFVGFESVEDAKKLTNSLLFTSLEDSKQNCSLDEDQFFWFDIIGCQIKENGIFLGKVVDVQRLPLDDYLIVETSKEQLLKYEKGANSFMVPYNKSFVSSVSIENKTIETQNCFDIFEAS